MSNLSILIYTDNPATRETGWVRQEIQNRGIDVDYKAPWDLVLPDFKPDYDLVYVPSNMLHRGTTFELLHRLILLRIFDENSIVVNPLESMLYYSKESLTLKLREFDLPHPRTLITENIDKAYDFARSLLNAGKEVVLKPICLARGIGVMKLSKIRSRGDLMQFLSWYSRGHGKGVYYLQEYVPNMGYDIRCFVIDGEVVGREKRSNPDDFRYNVSVGGYAEEFHDPVYDEIAVKVAEAMDFKITGLDILPRIDGEPVILEANCFPGYKALVETTGVNIPSLIADYFVKLLKK